MGARRISHASFVDPMVNRARNVASTESNRFTSGR